MNDNIALINELTEKINQTFLKRKKQTNLKLDQILDSKMKKANNDIETYCALLKYNIIFYKTLSRNTEALIEKWILDGYIPEPNKFNDQVKFITVKSRDYINEVMKQGHGRFKDTDRKSFNIYDSIDESIRQLKIERDYKILNLYKDLLNLALKEISNNNEKYKDILNNNAKMTRAALKKGIIHCVDNVILDKGVAKLDNKIADTHKEEKEEVQTPGSISAIKHEKVENKDDKYSKKIMEQISSMSYSELSSEISAIYEDIRNHEQLNESAIFGFSTSSIYELATAVLLLKNISGREYDFIKGAVSLVVIGEIGEGNFADVIKEILTETNTISFNAWNKMVDEVKNKFIDLRNNEATNRLIMPSEKLLDTGSIINKLKNISSDGKITDVFTSNSSATFKTSNPLKTNKTVSDLSREIEAVKDWQIEEYNREKEAKENLQRQKEEEIERLKNRRIDGSSSDNAQKNVKANQDMRTAKIFFNDIEELNEDENKKKPLVNKLKGIIKGDEEEQDVKPESEEKDNVQNKEDIELLKKLDANTTVKLDANKFYGIENNESETEHNDFEDDEYYDDEYYDDEYEDDYEYGERHSIKDKLLGFLKGFRNEELEYEDDEETYEEYPGIISLNNMKDSNEEHAEDNSEEEKNPKLEESEILSYRTDASDLFDPQKVKTIEEIEAEVKKEREQRKEEQRKEESKANVTDLLEYANKVKKEEAEAFVDENGKVDSSIMPPPIFNTEKDIEDLKPIPEMVTEKTESRIEEVKDSVSEKVNELKEEAETKAKEKAEELKEEVKEKTSELKAEIKENADKIDKTAEEKIIEAEKTVKDRISAAEKEVKEKATEAKTEAEDKLSEVKAEAKDRLSEAKAEAKDKLSEAKTEADEKVSELKAEIKENAEKIDKTAEEKITEVEKTVKDRISAAEKEVKEKATEAKTEAEEKLSEVKAEAEDKVAETKEKSTEIKEKAEEIKTEAKEKTSELKAEAKEKTAELKAETEEKTSEMKAEAKEKVAEIKADAEEKAKKIKTEAKEKVAEMKAEVKEKVEEKANAKTSVKVNPSLKAKPAKISEYENRNSRRLGPKAVTSDKNDETRRDRDYFDLTDVVVNEFKEPEAEQDKTVEKTVSSPVINTADDKKPEVLNEKTETSVNDEAKDDEDKDNIGAENLMYGIVDGNTDENSVKADIDDKNVSDIKKDMISDKEENNIIIEKEDRYTIENDDEDDDSGNESRVKVVRNIIIAAALIVAIAAAYVFTIKNQSRPDVTQINKKEEQAEMIKKQKEKQKLAAQSDKNTAGSDKNKENPSKESKEEKLDKKKQERRKLIEKYKDGKGLYYIVYVGTDTSRESAEYTAKEFKSRGIPVSIEFQGGFYKIVAGTFEDPYDAGSTIKTLGAKGIQSYSLKRDKYYDLLLEEFKDDAKTEPFNDVKEQYKKLNTELKGKKGFGDYVIELDDIYHNAVQKRVKSEMNGNSGQNSSNGNQNNDDNSQNDVNDVQ